MKTAGILGLIVVAGILTLAAFSHRILPADSDECQQDVTHKGNISELAVFHCIGHSETNPESGAWDHTHPWMTAEWHREHGLEESRAGSE